MAQIFNNFEDFMFMFDQVLVSRPDLADIKEDIRWVIADTVVKYQLDAILFEGIVLPKYNGEDSEYYMKLLLKLNNLSKGPWAALGDQVFELTFSNDVEYKTSSDFNKDENTRKWINTSLAFT